MDQILHSAWNNKIFQLSLIFIFITFFICGIFCIHLSLVICLSYFFGCLSSLCFIRYRFKISCVLQNFVNLYHGHIIPENKDKKSCNICDKSFCKRHKSAQFEEPWKKLYINKDLNTAIENVFNTILNNFVSSWYSNFTNDVTFTWELRNAVRLAVSNLFKRYLKLDIGRIIIKKIVPAVIKHIDCCIKIQEIAERQNIAIEQVALTNLGREIHVATTSRKNELKYLRKISADILPYLLLKPNTKCCNFNVIIRELIAEWVLLPLMDVIADPNIINLLINLTTTYKKKHFYHSHAEAEILHNFINYSNIKTTALGCELIKVFDNPVYLYAFMQFLKQYSSINILQFCLDVDEFNKKLLTPELTNSDLEYIHAKATNLHDLYLKPTSLNYIGCSPDITTNFESILSEGPASIFKFRTTTPLYKAYEYAFNTLENYWLCIFFHSDEFYKIICGPKISSDYKRVMSNRLLKKSSDVFNQGPKSKLSTGITKIKGAFRTQLVDGSVFLAEEQNYESDSPLFIEQYFNRDLSCWRVSINYVEQDPSSKQVSVFHINVKRIDSCSENERYWTVQRNIQDFHTLKMKLIEFHGENEINDSSLPSRRSSTSLETRRQKYEEFLQKLLQKPSLRGSDLIYTFLTTKENFTLLADTNVTIVSDLENMYQLVAHKLRKERGQKLDLFMVAYLSSTEIGQMKQKYDNPDVGEEAHSDVVVTKSYSLRSSETSIFKNNFNISLSDNVVYTHSSFKITDIISSIYYLLNKIFMAPTYTLVVYNAFCNVGYQAVNCLCKTLVEKGIKSNLSEYTAIHLVNLLKDSLFSKKSVPTKADLEQRKLNSFLNLKKANFGFIFHWLGLDVNTGLIKIWKVLQQPYLNKQLEYTVLDILINELFPECNFDDN